MRAASSGAPTPPALSGPAASSAAPTCTAAAASSAPAAGPSPATVTSRSTATRSGCPRNRYDPLSMSCPAAGASPTTRPRSCPASPTSLYPTCSGPPACPTAAAAGSAGDCRCPTPNTGRHSPPSPSYHHRLPPPEGRPRIPRRRGSQWTHLRCRGHRIGSPKKLESILWGFRISRRSGNGGTVGHSEGGLVGAGHNRVVEQLLQVLVQLQSGDADTPRLVLLRGPSGVGKSRVVRELYERLRDAQPDPGYWPPLTDHGMATGAGVDPLASCGWSGCRGGPGRAVLSFTQSGDR